MKLRTVLQISTLAIAALGALSFDIAVKLFPPLSTAVLAAEEPRKIDFTQHVLDEHGDPVRSGEAKDAAPMTLGALVAIALFRDEPAPQGQAGDPIKKAKRALLALRLQGSGATDEALTSDEITEIKHAISVFAPLLNLRVIEIIDPAALKK